MKKILVTTMGLLFVASTALALRVPMWRKVWEQDGTRYYVDHGSLKQYDEEWSFGYLQESSKGKVTATHLCKKSENGVWVRHKNITNCDEEECYKQKDTDWKEVSYETIAYHICKVVLPYCDEPSKGKKGMCQKRPKKDEDAAEEKE